MEITVKVELTLAAPLLDVLVKALGTSVENIGTVGIKAEDKPIKKEKPVKSEAAAQTGNNKPPIGISDIRQWAIKSADNKKAMRDLLIKYGVAGDPPKLDQLPADKIEAFYNELTEEV